MLKGPQGTLFGRNAAAGVVSVIPNVPSDEIEGFVSLWVKKGILFNLQFFSLCNIH